MHKNGAVFPLLHQMLPGTLHSTLRKVEWPLPYNLPDEGDGVLEEENLFTFISSHSVCLNRWVASEQSMMSKSSYLSAFSPLYNSSNLKEK